MSILAETDLDLEDIAMLADGSSISDETAKRFSPLVWTDSRLVEPLRELRQMAEDAGTTLLEDALSAHRDFERLEAESWDHPADVLDVSVGISYEELISLATARSGRTEGTDKERLIEMREGLQAAYEEHLAEERAATAFLEHLLTLDGAVAEALLNRLSEQQRLRRRQQEGQAEGSASGGTSVP